MKNRILVLAGVLFLVSLIFGSFQSAQAASLANNLKGRILLQVESKGEAWYVNPTDLQRYFLGSPDQALNIMRCLGLGISNQNLGKILTSQETASSSQTNTSLANAQKGKLLLQVESKGEAWYVNPVDGRRYSLGRPSNALAVMRFLGLGVKSIDLQQISIGTKCAGPAPMSSVVANRTIISTPSVVARPAVTIGCQYNNPACVSGRVCQKNLCVLRDPAIKCYIDSDCDDRSAETTDKCIFPGQKNSRCQNQLIRAYCDSSRCASNEICMNGSCTKAPLTLVMINGGFGAAEFDRVVKEDIETLANATPLINCPQQIKVIKSDLCCPKGQELTTCAKTKFANFDAVVYSHPYKSTPSSCNVVSSVSSSIIVIDCAKAFVHELGHALFGFADQYCYNATKDGRNINPLTDVLGCGYSAVKREYTCPLSGICWNRKTHENDRMSGFCYSNDECAMKYKNSDYECVAGFIPLESSWDWNYCSRYNNPPIYTMGNMNMYGDDRSVMGNAFYGEKTAFDKSEYAIIESTLHCK